MKDILRQIADILYDVPLMNRNRMIGIINPLDNEKQANVLLKYLEESKDNPNAMRIKNSTKYYISILVKNSKTILFVL